MRKRVVVTGLGIVSPLGNDLETAWTACRSGRSGIGLITRFDASDLKTHIAGEVRNFEIPSVIPAKDAKKMDVLDLYAIAATQQALDDAGLKITDDIADDVGVSLGVGIGGEVTLEKNVLLMEEKGPGRISPFFVPMILPNMAAGYVSLTFGTRNYNAVTLSACASSSHAIGDAFRHIERGDAKAMIVGGSEGALTKLCMGGFAAMKALSTRNDAPEKASRPYDRDRDGFVFSEGAAILILEELEFAQARGARIYCELAGYGVSSDAHHISAPTVEGPARSIRLAIKDAGATPDQLDYINAHATSTPVGDINELRAIQTVLQDHASKISVSATKSMTGHMLGAAGAIEAVLTVMAMQDNFVPPSINIDNLDPDCELDVTPNEGRERSIDLALSNSFGFGGTNASLVFRRLKDV
ncbi:beta-ketoacyl-ACP synthase II [Pokkaliibacter sp. MBI-7]|uniref:beta-ketoacyl-ACP synthase II n=1 Tax=Pokkaliibacter sp. MBI-7 TaxID=3040600 RepID=UPI00244810EE|nr:beta-ketoacyl-ACP synthase II [Pokkaliibacter sp. MBI-7]MDH2435889.1 beta-ketoacyl-ACP synthase II [Pokkaliibacter sp. MBI-7]